MACVAVMLSSTAAHSQTAQPISDEALRVAALRAIFPGKQISINVGNKIEDSWPKQQEPRRPFFPDALAGESVYSVIGEATNEAERTASENLQTGRFSKTRQVRIKLFHWPNARSRALLAVIQYDFAGANPALSCPSIGLLVQLVRNAGNWEWHNQYLLETTHHSSIQRIELVDLVGAGTDELVIESSYGGAGTAGSSLQVFDLSQGRFDELLDTNSRLEYQDLEGYTQVLDVERTVHNRGQLFCVLKSTLFENGKWFDPPRVSRPCYKRGEGVDSRKVRGRNAILAPLH